MPTSPVSVYLMLPISFLAVCLIIQYRACLSRLYHIKRHIYNQPLEDCQRRTWRAFCRGLDDVQGGKYCRCGVGSLPGNQATGTRALGSQNTKTLNIMSKPLGFRRTQELLLQSCVFVPRKHANNLQGAGWAVHSMR